MFAVALVGSFAAVAAVVGASATLTRRFWADAPWLAPAYGLLGLGVTAQVAWITCWWSRTASVVFGLAVLAGAGTYCVWQNWRRWRTWLPLSALTASLASMLVGHEFLWGGVRVPFLTTEARYGSLPGDNLLQYKFAFYLWNNLPTAHFDGDWNGSDRPPLQSGILLLVRPWERLVGVSDNAIISDTHATQWGLAAGVAAQFLWVLGVYSLLRALRLRRDLTFLAIAFASVVPLVVWNSVFTWPKLLSAAFALASMAVLVECVMDRRRSPVGPVVVAGALAVLAYLSHGGAAFAAPALAVLTVLALRAPPKVVVRTGLGAAVVSAVLYAPWMAYSKWADPNHARLLKWHLAGETTANDEPFLRTLVHAYQQASGSYLVSAREANLRRAFDLSLGRRLHPGGSWVHDMRSQDFFSPTFAIGLGTVLTAAFIAVAARRWLLGRRSGAVDLSLVVVLVNLASMVLWAMAMFLPDGAVVHTGTYVWLLVFAAVPFAWLARWSRPVAVVVLLLQAGYVAVVYNDPGATLERPELSQASLAALCLGVVGVLATLAAVWVRKDSLDRGVEDTAAPLNPGRASQPQGLSE